MDYRSASPSVIAPSATPPAHTPAPVRETPSVAPLPATPPKLAPAPKPAYLDDDIKRVIKSTSVLFSRSSFSILDPSGSA